MSAPQRYEVGVGILVVAAGALLVYMALEIGAIGSFGEVVLVEAVMDDVAGLSEGAVVSVAGVPVGRVEGLAVYFDKARAKLSIEATAGIRRDVTVSMRARSVLGEKYLDLAPHSPDAPLLINGDVITQTKGQFEIDEMVTAMGPLVAAMDPTAIADIVAALAGAIREDPQRPARMLADAERTLNNLAVTTDAAPALVEDVRGTLASVRRTSDAARPVVAKADTLVARLDEVVAAVPPAQVPALLADIQAAVTDGRAVLVKLDSSTGDLSSLLSKADDITEADLNRFAREDGVLIRLFPKKAEKP
jgi:phospholipid/cholesterol/gamma-HCH transport system substrate-binding protein